MSETTNDLAMAMRAFRRRWASGVAVVTLAAEGGDLRGITVTALMPVSLDPPVLALALTADGGFAAMAAAAPRLGVSVLEAGHEFWSERFAGRAPVPDARFTGIGHDLVDGVPRLEGALAWVSGTVSRIERVGDHDLVLLDLDHVESGVDTDDPLLSYEGRYRRLEAG